MDLQAGVVELQEAALFILRSGIDCRYILCWSNPIVD